MTCYKHQFTVEGGKEKQKGKEGERKRGMGGEREEKRRKTERETWKEED